jgi:hypothetical protein
MCDPYPPYGELKLQAIGVPVGFMAHSVPGTPFALNVHAHVCIAGDLMNSRQPPASSEEPELSDERDIPTEGDAPSAADPGGARVNDRHRSSQPQGEKGPDPGGPESVAGEEDPGAALDTEPDSTTAPNEGT